MRWVLLLTLAGCLEDVPVGKGDAGNLCKLGPTGCPEGCVTLTGVLVDQTAHCVHEDAHVVIGCQPTAGSPNITWCYRNGTMVEVRTTQQIEFGLDPSWRDCLDTQQVAMYPDCQ